jgi:hypothetical protein
LAPQATLQRGYSLVSRRRTGEIVRSPRQVCLNDPLEVRTAGGAFPALATPPPRAQQGDWIEQSGWSQSTEPSERPRGGDGL